MIYNKNMDFDADEGAEYASQIIENSTICIFNDALKITYTNYNFNKLTGYKKGELTGKSLLKIQHNGNNDTAHSFAIDTIKSGDTWKGEFQIIHKNRQTLWLDTTISPLNKNSCKRLYIAIFLNISEKKKLITDLKQRAQEQGLIAILGQISLNNIPVYDLLEQALSVACASLEIESGLILEINTNTANTAKICTRYNTPYISNKHKKHIDIQSLLEHISGNEKHSISALLPNESRFDLPEIFLINDFKFSIFVLIGDKKKPFGILSLLSKKPCEISTFKINFLHSICNILAEAIIRQNIEKSLRHEKDLSRKYLDVANIMIIAIDKKEKIILTNQKAEETLGYSRHDLSGLNFFDTFLPEEIRSAIRGIFHDIFNGKKPVEDLMALRNNVIPMINNMSQTRYIKWKSSLLYDNDGNIISVLSAGEDITETIAYEKEQKKLMKQLHQAQKMEAIGTLAGGIAHDFNNILSSILGFSDLALEKINQNKPEGNNKTLVTYINYIQQSGLKARDIILQLQSINLNNNKPDEVTLLPGLLKGTLKMLSSAIPADINLNYIIDDNLPPVHMDPSKLNQIILNLLINARKGLEHANDNNNNHGEIKISLAMEKTSNTCCLFCGKKINGDYATLSVHNNNTVDNSGSLSAIFTSESDNTADAELMLVAQLIHDSNGHILINPNKKKHSKEIWTKVSLIFDTLSARSPASKNRQIDLSNIQNKHLMVVDDENSVATCLGELLKSAGFKVSVFCDSVDALSSFHNDPDSYDLIITDQIMPAITGNLLAERMLQIRPDLPIILCSSHNDFLKKEQSRDLNISAFLKKPLDSAELLHQVATQLLDNQV